MKAHKLVLIDGLPGSGTSTIAHLLCLHLGRHGEGARWFWEMEAPHPIVDFQDAIAGEALRPGFLETATARWQALATGLACGDATAIVESTFLQSTVQPMFALDWDPARIAAHVAAAAQAVTPAAPILVLLHFDDVGAAFDEVSRVRGSWFPELIEAKVSATPYARRRGLSGRNGAVEYLRSYQALTTQIVAGLRLPTVVIDAGRGFATIVPELVRVLGLPPFAPFDTAVSDLAAFAGRYQRTDSDDCCSVVADGSHLYVEGAPNTRLIQRDTRRFDLAGTCVQYEFHPGADGRMERLECRGNFPNLAPAWVRHK